MINESRYIDISINDIHHIIKKNDEDLRVSQQIRKKRNENQNHYSKTWSRHDFYREILSDMYIDGFVENYPHGNVVRQAQRSYYYRGENQIFKSSKASLYRKLHCIAKDDEKLAEKFVAYMRNADFLWLLLKFDHVQKFISEPLIFNNKNLGYGISLLYEQLAQHYGLDSPWLDITSDFEVALFFACCKFNHKEKKWLPLNKSDFLFNPPHTQYGIIFRQLSDHPNNLSYDPHLTQILPVGFQPFMRCHMQNSYVAKIDESKSLQDDTSFQILRFKHSEFLCNFIFNKMKKGKLIYPHEGLSSLSDYIEHIKQKKIFTQEIFDYTIQKPDFKNVKKDNIKKLLDKYDYQIINASNYIPKNKIEEINNNYHNFDIEKSYNIKLTTRLVYIPPHNNQ
ncbi:MAG: FRG domain-containing protein [Prolixibacteraceae bacterium]|jgi:hypothetical protein|nr:FRG domain-containing protein [Prolixibacteraceae bacterium]